MKTTVIHKPVKFDVHLFQKSTNLSVKTLSYLTLIISALIKQLSLIIRCHSCNLRFILLTTKQTKKTKCNQHWAQRTETFPPTVFTFIPRRTSS